MPLRQSAHLILLRSTARPYLGADALGNAMVEAFLRHEHYDVTTHALLDHDTQANDLLLPFRHCRLREEMAGAARADLAIYDDFGLSAYLPDPGIARRTMVLFHGLAGAAAVWTGAPSRDIDLFCTNSDYLNRVLTSVLALPDWSKGRCSHPQPFQVVATIQLPVSAFEEDDAAVAARGAELPARVRALLQGPDFIGHAIQPAKLDLAATCPIMVLLNMLAAQNGDPGRFRLCIHEHDFQTLMHSLANPDPRRPDASQALAMALAGLRMKMEDVFIPVPWLRQSALFALMQDAAFCLSYQQGPESLGFYVMESILKGCPVYSNGAGNIRSLLPEGHGLVVAERPGMYFGEQVEFGPVAEAIYAGIRDQAGGRAACARGAALIRERYSRARFDRDMRAALDRVDAAREPAAPPFDELRVSLGPLVRQWDVERGRLVSDYVHRQLTPSQRQLVIDSLQRRCGELRALPAEPLAELHRLFQGGVLALQPDGDQRSGEGISGCRD
jgi:hypothetical protein